MVTKYQDGLASVEEEVKAPVWPIFLNKPVYAIYTDTDVQASDKAGKMSSDVRNRLVCGTIHSMVTAASSPSFNRLPT